MILEESDQLGGRIRKFEFAGHVFEAGANHIHGTKNKRTRNENPIWTLAKEV